MSRIIYRRQEILKEQRHAYFTQTGNLKRTVSRILYAYRKSQKNCVAHALSHTANLKGTVPRPPFTSGRKSIGIAKPATGFKTYTHLLTSSFLPLPFFSRFRKIIQFPGSVSILTETKWELPRMFGRTFSKKSVTIHLRTSSS
jgi:hypothetical protein